MIRSALGRTQERRRGLGLMLSLAVSRSPVSSFRSLLQLRRRRRRSSFVRTVDRVVDPVAFNRVKLQGP